MSEKNKQTSTIEGNEKPTSQDFSFEAIILAAEKMDGTRPEVTNLTDKNRVDSLNREFEKKISMTDAKLGKVLEYTFYSISDSLLDAGNSNYKVRTGRSSEFDDINHGADILVGIENSDGVVAQMAIDTTWNEAAIPSKLQKRSNYLGGLPKGLTPIKYQNKTVTPDTVGTQVVPRLVVGLEKENAVDFTRDVFIQQSGMELPQDEQAYVLSVRKNLLEEMSLQALGMRHAMESDDKATAEMKKQIAFQSVYLNAVLAKTLLRIDLYDKNPKNEYKVGSMRSDFHNKLLAETSRYYGIHPNSAIESAKKRAKQILDKRNAKLGEKAASSAIPTGDADS